MHTTQVVQSYRTTFTSVEYLLLRYLLLVNTVIKYDLTFAQAPFYVSNKDMSTSNKKSSSISSVHPRLKQIFNFGSSVGRGQIMHSSNNDEYKEETLNQINLKSLSYSDKKEEETCRKMVQSLTEEELEEAANTSYKYYSSTNSNKNNDATTTTNYGLHAAMKMAKRHLDSEHGNYTKALQRMKDALIFRKDIKINASRSAFQKSSVKNGNNDNYYQSHLRSQILTESLKQPMVISGYDKLNRALLLLLGRSCRSTDKESFINTHLYMIERAIACTEHASSGTQDKIAVIVNCADFEYVPSTKLLKDFFRTMEKHYPKQLAYLALIDAPVLVRSIWFIIKPFIQPEVVELIKFVSGDEQKIKMISPLIDKEQAMPFVHPDGKLNSTIDMLHFLQNIPFHYDYGK